MRLKHEVYIFLSTFEDCMAVEFYSSVNLNYVPVRVVVPSACKKPGPSLLQLSLEPTAYPGEAWKTCIIRRIIRL